MLASELQRLRRLPKPLLAHDDLGARYDPVWLRDVAQHAERHGLRYLADAEPAELRADRQPPGVDAQLDALAGGSRVVWEQYADLLAGRAFRQTLLCRAGAPLDDAIAPARMERLWFRATESAGGGGAEGEPGSGPRHDSAGNGSSGAPAVARLALARPRSFAFDELHETLGGRDPAALAAELWQAFRAGEVELASAPDRHVTAAGERPATSALARWQAARGPELTNLRHEPVRLNDPLGRMLIRLCDGTRDRPALVDALVGSVGGELLLTVQGEPVTDGETGARADRGRAGGQPRDPRRARDAARLTGSVVAPMWNQREIRLRARPRGFHLVTREVAEALPELGELRVGLAHLHLLHTSASLTLNENASPDVRRDFESWFDRAVPEDAPLLDPHRRGARRHAGAHQGLAARRRRSRSRSATARFALGTWQGVYLCEHRDHGGARSLLVTLWGEELAEERQRRLALAAQLGEVDLDPGEPARLRQHPRLRLDHLRREHAAAVGHRRVEPDPLEVAARAARRRRSCRRA